MFLARGGFFKIFIHFKNTLYLHIRLIQWFEKKQQTWNIPCIVRICSCSWRTHITRTRHVISRQWNGLRTCNPVYGIMCFVWCKTSVLYIHYSSRIWAPLRLIVIMYVYCTEGYLLCVIKFQNNITTMVDALCPFPSAPPIRRQYGLFCRDLNACQLNMDIF